MDASPDGLAVTGSRTLKLTLEYDGTDFFGWQVQPDRRTVQGEVERAIAEVSGEPVRIHGASRTDTGVHALGQVASFATGSRLTAPALQRALNAVLPEDVAVRAVDEVDATFHARKSASGKHYRYRIVNRKERAPLERRHALHVREPLDVAAMNEAVRHIVGEHDFQGFETESTLRYRELEAKGRSIEHASVRRIHAARVTHLPAPVDALVAFDVAGTGFLYNMVRTLVGTLLQVGRGKRPPSDVADIVASRERARAGPTAVPRGLFLMRVFYGEEARIPDPGEALFSSETGVSK
jgi:tRNA pseudouridine38-40 synthase